MPHLHIHILHPPPIILQGRPLIHSSKYQHRRIVLNTFLVKRCRTQLLTHISPCQLLKFMPLRPVLIDSWPEAIHIPCNHIDIQRVERTRRRCGPVSTRMCDTLGRPQDMGNPGQRQRLIFVIPD